VNYADALKHPNVRAFLAVIRAGEGTADQDGYRRHFGGALFDSFADHPRKAITAGLGKNKYTSTAAGAYQFLSRTWDECQAALSLPDFSPASQDLAAVFLIDRRKALQDVIDGRIEDAIRKCAREWASLPTSPYGQPVKTMEQALATYAKAGGVLRPNAPVETRIPTPVPNLSTNVPIFASKEQPVAVPPALIPIAIDALLNVVPALGRIFSSGSAVAERNLEAATVIVNTAKQAIGAKNEQELVEMVNSDPQAAQAVKQALEQDWFQITDLLIKAGKADEESRAAAQDRNLLLAKETGGKWLWLLGTVAVLVILFSYGITVGVMFLSGSTFSDETKAMLLGQIVIFGFGTVLAFLFGSNIQNRITDAKK
jgi:muramidase (phage lysozyme)